MNRRQFLTRALATVPVVLASEQLAELLAPRKSIFLPPRGGWGGRSTLELLSAHLERVRPVAQLIRCQETDLGMENCQWSMTSADRVLVITIPAFRSPNYDRLMRQALLNYRPESPIPTYRDLLPWEKKS